jgi:CRP-like cAMP-binding protein
MARISVKLVEQLNARQAGHRGSPGVCLRMALTASVGFIKARSVRAPPEDGEAKSQMLCTLAYGHAVQVALYSPAMPEDLLANRLLAVLGPEERDRLLRGAKSEPIDAHQVLHAADREISHVYFPVSGVVSLVVKMTNAADVEVMTIGNEGVIGIPVILGVVSTTMEGVCQIPGRALKVPARVILEEIRRTASVSRLLLRYSEAVMVQLAQHAACNRTHSMEQRCARWLLMARDRVASDEFPLTQQFLAEMLGVRRATVTVVAGALQKAGLIDYSRGRIHIVNRRGLERVACECYEVVRRVMKNVTA